MTRANCKQALRQQSSANQAIFCPKMTIKKNGQEKPITNEMIGNVLQKLMAA